MFMLKDPCSKSSKNKLLALIFIVFFIFSVFALSYADSMDDSSDSQGQLQSSTPTIKHSDKQIEIATDWLKSKYKKDKTKQAEKLAEYQNLKTTDIPAFNAQTQKFLNKRFSALLKEAIFGVAGGLGLFLFGMSIMSDALKKSAGKSLKKVLESLTKNPVMAVLLGASATALIQSSSATTVMVVGFVNAGLMTLKQSLCVVLGANIGTTITAWIVSLLGIGAFKITLYALPAIGLGFLLRIGGRNQRFKNLGNIMLGFGILFIGINFMKDGFTPLKDSESVQNALIWLGGNPIYAVLAGTIITVLLQSSSASIAIIQIMAIQGAFGMEWETVLSVTIPFILGDNIGTTITAQLAALQASRNSKRVAMGHTMFNALGVIIILPIVWAGWYADFIQWIVPATVSGVNIIIVKPLIAINLLAPERVIGAPVLNMYSIAFYIAIAHTIFNVCNTIVFLPLIGVLEFVVMKILPVKPDELSQKPVNLEEHLLSSPDLAIGQAKREIVRMTKTSKRAFVSAVDGLMNNDLKLLHKARLAESATDNFQYEITSYLAMLSTKELSEEISSEIPVLLHTINDVERTGDHAVNIAEIAERKIEQHLVFTDSAQQEARDLREKAIQMFDLVIVAFEEHDTESAKKTLDIESIINKKQVEYRRSHVIRMTESVCTAEAGLIFIDLVDNVEKIGDHLTNIAQSVIGGLQWEGFDEKNTYSQ